MSCRGDVCHEVTISRHVCAFFFLEFVFFFFFSSRRRHTRLQGDWSSDGVLFRSNHGTLFLDEVGTMAPSTQAKLLRVLEEGCFMRLGGLRQIQVDVRIIAATNLDLKEAALAGTFREDLFYRLNVVPLHIPPLRDRPEDILPLALDLVRELNRELKKSF